MGYVASPVSKMESGKDEKNSQQNSAHYRLMASVTASGIGTQRIMKAKRSFWI